MTDENDTKELTIVHKQPTPDTSREGELMPLTLEERFEAFKVLTEERLKTINATIAGFKSADEIDASIDRAVQTHFGRVETLVNTAVTEFGSAAFVIERMDAVATQLNLMNETLNTRTANAAESDRKLDRVIQFINTLAADDVTDPESKKTSKSWFERMEQQIAQNEERSLAAVVEVSQVRADHVQSMNANAQTAREIKDGLAKIDTGLAKIDTTNEALAEFRAFAEQIQGVLKAFKHLRENPLQLVALVTAFGTGGYAVPELFRLAVRLLTGVN